MIIKEFQEQVKKNAGKPAVKTARQSITYSELDTAANGVANAIITMAPARNRGNNGNKERQHHKDVD